MFDHAITSLENNLAPYSIGKSPAVKSRLKTASKSFICYVHHQRPEIPTNKLEYPNEILSQKLREWKEEYYAENNTTDRSKRECLSSFFKYLRHLIKENKFPEITFPSTRKNLEELPGVILKNVEAKQVQTQTTPFNPFIFRPSTSQKDKKGYPHDVSFLDKFENGEELAKCFEQYQTGLSYGRQAKSYKMLVSFIQFEYSGLELRNDNFQIDKFMRAHAQRYIDNTLRNRGSRSLITINTDLQILRKIYSHFARKGFFPAVDIQNPLRGIDRKIPQLKSNPKLLAQAIANFSRKDQHNRKIESAFSMTDKSDTEFLNALERDERFAFNLIREACIQEARRIIKKFDEGQELIASCDIEYIRTVHKETGRLLDPNIRGAKDQQLLSFFSPDHPNGLVNLLGYYWHEYSGLAMNRAFAGASFAAHYGMQNLKDYLGLNNKNSLPFFIIIVGETGVNVDSLEGAIISDQYNNNLILTSSGKAGYEKFAVSKPRARKFLEKHISIGGTDDLGDVEINAHVCLNYILKMTTQYRKADNSKNLWIGPYFSTTPYAATKISASAFKTQLKQLLSSHSNFVGTDHRFFTRANIRVSAGVLKWFESGGDAATVAQFLGNSVSTSMKNYIPASIQEALYRRSIRKFQNILIVASTKDSPATLERALVELNELQISNLVQKVCESTDWQVASLSGERPFNSSPKNKSVLAVSPTNIALLKLINDSILDARLTNPTDAQARVPIGGRDQVYWLELWSFTNLSLRNSSDRGLRRIFKDGLDLAKKMERG